MKLDTKIILLTGASSGIGKALTEELTNHKCKIVALARNMEVLQELEKKYPERVFAYKCDVTKFEEIESVYSDVKKNIGIPDIVILNAGISNKSNIEDYNSKEAINLVNTNFSSNLIWMENILPDFIKRKSGLIAAVSSLADNRAYSLSSVYSATKSALTYYLEGISIEAKKHNIKVCTIRPGFIKSQITDKNNFRMPFLMESDKAAKIIIKGLIKEKRYIQFPFKMVLLTRMIGLIPNSLFEFLFNKFLTRK